MLMAIVIYFFFVITVLFGGFIIKAIYKGYLSAKNRELGLIQDLDIDNAIFALAGFPIVLIIMVFLLISEIPFWFGKLLGKLLK